MAVTSVLVLSLLGVQCSLALERFGWTTTDHSWGYYDAPEGKRPKDWPHLRGQPIKICAGQRQSPIDIIAKDAVTDASLGEFTLTGWDDTLENGEMNVENDGHSLKFHIPLDKIYTDGAGLPAKMTLVQFHFHWGSWAHNGSEHDIDDIPYAGELHFVHLNTEFSEEGTWLENLDGVAVLAVILEEVDSPDNTFYQPLLDAMEQVPYPDSPFANVTAVRPVNLLPPNTDKYYRYEGSFTTPNCQQVVTWTVFTEKVKISKAQFDRYFRNKHYEENKDEEENRFIVDNFRPPQPLYDRIVYKSAAEAGVPYVPSSSVSHQGASLVIILAAVISKCL